MHTPPKNSPTKSTKLLFVVNDFDFFVSHRLHIGLEAASNGFEVHVATAPNTSNKEILRSKGITHHNIPISRSGKNPLKELRLLLSLYSLLKKVKPDIAHFVTIKPVIFGGIAARLAKVPALVFAISGLGLIFISRGPSAKLARRIACFFYRIALNHKNMKVIFQNPHDMAIIGRYAYLRPTDTTIIKGSGVDLNLFSYCAEPSGIPVVTMAARLLKDKGVYEFVDAAKLLARRGVKVEMWLAGSPDDGNPTTVSRKDLETWTKEGAVKVLGYREDISQLYQNSHVVCLPSYREGLPKALIEAAACGRPIVTTDTPGCRDAIIAGCTGLLVQPRDSTSLANAIQKLIEQPLLRSDMGIAARKHAETHFDIKTVVNQHLKIYRELYSLCN